VSPLGNETDNSAEVISDRRNTVQKIFAEQEIVDLLTDDRKIITNATIVAARELRDLGVPDAGYDDLNAQQRAEVALVGVGFLTTLLARPNLYEVSRRVAAALDAKGELNEAVLSETIGSLALMFQSLAASHAVADATRAAYEERTHHLTVLLNELADPADADLPARLVEFAETLRGRVPSQISDAGG
jgi:hypothetical protein